MSAQNVAQLNPDDSSFQLYLDAYDDEKYLLSFGQGETRSSVSRLSHLHVLWIGIILTDVWRKGFLLAHFIFYYFYDI